MEEFIQEKLSHGEMPNTIGISPKEIAYIAGCAEIEALIPFQ